MIDKIEKAGISGAGGAGFPTFFKLGAKAEYYIINAAECEPLLESDRNIMLRNAEKIISGIKKVKKIIDFKKAYIGIKQKNTDCGELLKKFIDVDYIEVKILKNIYPSGDEQVMIYEILGKIVPEGGIPLNIGVIVNNVETVYRIEKAISENEVFNKRYVTVNGEIEKPCVMELPLGISFSDILEFAGKKKGINYIAIDGGPMMGKITDIKDGVVKKTTSGILFLSENHELILRKTQSIKNIFAQAQASCCNCMTCTELCSRYLIGHRMEPHKIMRALCSQNFDEKIFEYATLCSECNICELYACPINLSPKTVNQFLKEKFRKEGKKINIKKDSYEAPEERSGRQIPSDRIINRLDIKKYYKKLEFKDEIPEFTKVFLKLSQHIGAPSKPIVSVGQNVKKGDIIAEKNGNLSMPLHSSVDGKVVEVGSDTIIIEVSI
ncbi:MAG: SLBB domain-containing protein [Candidatus Muirbacterium halophilum]|nr:SLBB domain-containing protein [Candidatus Muirbacterium halophilum]MCK9475289.1 SLBB domain-containing protein [Candidatus Muirbacterium halophilum]